jgi:hypothetical protein
MYLLFRFHHLMPWEYIKRNVYEKRVIKSFMYRYLKDLEDKYSALRGDY